MSTSVLVRGTLHQRHSRVLTNDATSSHRLHSIERERVENNEEKRIIKESYSTSDLSA